MKTRRDKLHLKRGYKSLEKILQTISKHNFRNRLQRIDMIASLIIQSCIHRKQQIKCSSGCMNINKKLAD